MICPKCNSENTVKNGHIHNGKQKFMCKECGRQFVPDPGNKIISHETKELIGRLLLEKISPVGIARSTDVSERWLQYYINDKYQIIPGKVMVTEKKRETDDRM